jgi:hypothetical protein
MLIFFGGAPYLNYMTAAVLLSAVASTRMMALTAVWNAALFLFFVPIPSSQLTVNVVNAYVGRFTRAAIEKQWVPNLSEFKRDEPPGPDKRYSVEKKPRASSAN